MTYEGVYEGERLNRIAFPLGDVPPAEFERLYAAQEDRLISLSMKEGTT